MKLNDSDKVTSCSFCSCSGSHYDNLSNTWMKWCGHYEIAFECFEDRPEFCKVTHIKVVEEE